MTRKQKIELLINLINQLEEKDRNDVLLAIAARVVSKKGDNA